MKPQVVFQKFIAGKTWRVAKHRTVSRIQVCSGCYWVNIDSNHAAIINQSKSLEFGQLRNAAKLAGVSL